MVAIELIEAVDFECVEVGVEVAVAIAIAVDVVEVEVVDNVVVLELEAFLEFEKVAGYVVEDVVAIVVVVAPVVPSSSSEVVVDFVVDSLKALQLVDVMVGFVEEAMKIGVEVTVVVIGFEVVAVVEVAVAVGVEVVVVVVVEYFPKPFLEVI